MGHWTPTGTEPKDYDDDDVTMKMAAFDPPTHPVTLSHVSLEFDQPTHPSVTN